MPASNTPGLPARARPRRAAHPAWQALARLRPADPNQSGVTPIAIYPHGLSTVPAEVELQIPLRDVVLRRQAGSPAAQRSTGRDQASAGAHPPSHNRTGPAIAQATGASRLPSRCAVPPLSVAPDGQDLPRSDGEEPAAAVCWSAAQPVLNPFAALLFLRRRSPVHSSLAACTLLCTRVSPAQCALIWSMSMVSTPAAAA